MLIFVHSSGRADISLPTLDHLLAGPLHKQVRLVVQDREAKAYAARHPKVKTIVLPSKIRRLSPTRQWLLENSPTDKFILMDDDLAFACRRHDDPTRFLHSEPEETAKALIKMEGLLDKFAHVGMLGREGGNRVTEPIVYCTRMMRVLGYRKSIVHDKVGARFDRLPIKQDFDMTLQLLRAGYDNAVLATHVQNQAGSNTSGGCSVYRNPGMMRTASIQLAKLHPGFVKVVEKETKAAWGGGVRTDVQIAWKKARASAGTTSPVPGRK